MSGVTATVMSRKVCSCIRCYHDKLLSKASPTLWDKRDVSYSEVQQTVFRAVDIPMRFWKQRCICSEALLVLEEVITLICSVKFNELYGKGGDRNCESLLHAFQDVVYEEVRQLIRDRYQLELTPQDESQFKGSSPPITSAVAST